jgi:CrcB protein
LVSHFCRSHHLSYQLALHQDFQTGCFLNSVILVFLGGAIGSSLRWITSEFISNGALVVLLVNVLGTAVAGYFSYMRVPNDRLQASNQRAFWITGFAGGLTTFSSFAFFVAELDTLKAIFFAALNLFLSLALLMVMQRPKSLEIEDVV